MIGRAARRWKKIESVKGPEYVASVRSIANVLPKGAAEVLRASYVLRGAITLDGRQARWCLSHDLIKSIADGFGLYMITSKGADVWRAHCEAKR